MATADLRAQLVRRLAEARIAAPDTLVRGLVEYLELLARWNRRINLTAFDLTAPSDAALDRLIVEPLVAARHVRPDDGLVVDIGSGGGSPAIPLKLAVPTIRLVMVEARARKCAFLREAVRVLHLQDAHVVTERLEAASIPASLQGAVDLVVIRAVRLDAALWATVEALGRAESRVFLFQKRVDALDSDVAAERLGWFESEVAPIGSEAVVRVLARRPRLHSQPLQ